MVVLLLDLDAKDWMMLMMHVVVLQADAILLFLIFTDVAHDVIV